MTAGGHASAGPPADERRKGDPSQQQPPMQPPHHHILLAIADGDGSVSLMRVFPHIKPPSEGVGDLGVGTYPLTAGAARKGQGQAAVAGGDVGDGDALMGPPPDSDEEV